MSAPRPSPLLKALARALETTTDTLRLTAVGGGCVSDTARVEGGSHPAFLKREPLANGWQLTAEAEGLETLSVGGGLLVPRPLARGETEEQAWLLLEYLPLDHHHPSDTDWAAMGRALAATHARTAEQHGWHRDNALGGTHQDNTPRQDWADFFRDHRLRPQLALAARQGHGERLQERGERLLALLPTLLDHQPAPSLLHGDFWGGNAGFCRGQPATWDPAVHYGDRECDLAMAALFGGFGNGFWRAYEAEWPLPPGHPTRRDLYQLYHVLNHLNLFGGGYRGSALRLIDRLLDAARA